LQSPPHHLLSLCDIIPTKCDAHQVISTCIYILPPLQRREEEEEEKATINNNIREKKDEAHLALKYEKKRVERKRTEGVACGARKTKPWNSDRYPYPTSSPGAAPGHLEFSDCLTHSTNPNSLLSGSLYIIVSFLFAFPLFLSSDSRALLSSGGSYHFLGYPHDKC
jgi:hypothetical protein